MSFGAILEQVIRSTLPVSNRLEIGLADSCVP